MAKQFNYQDGKQQTTPSHEEYRKEIDRRRREEERAVAGGNTGGGRTASPTSARQSSGGGGDDDDEPTFADKPLSFFDGKSDEQILAVKGVGEHTLREIRAAQKDRDAAGNGK
jgi:hypothetical protein